MTTNRIHFTQERATNLITLYSKAVQSRWQNPILQDPWAEEAVRHIDYNFSKIKGGKIGAMIVAIRARNFDLWTTQYLADHPGATVLHVGCGMDSRVFRVDPPASVQWFDIDYRDVIDLRRQLYPERPSYRLIGSSLADLHWLDEVPGNSAALIVAEGVLMYLTEDNVKALLNALTRHFASGQMIFDALHPWVVRRGSNVADTGASFKWGINDPQDIKLLDPKLELVTELRSRDLSAYNRFPVLLRVLLAVLDLFPSLRRMNRLLRYQWGEVGHEHS